MDNTSDMKTPYEIRPEGTTTILSELAMQHMQSTSSYRDISKALKKDDDTASDYFLSLADYHDGMLQELNQVIGDMPGGANTPSESGQADIREHEKEVNRALQSKNVVELAELAHENEQKLSRTYEKALANSKLIDFVGDLLHKQHEKILIWVNRADRYKTVPQEFNHHYDEDNE